VGLFKQNPDKKGESRHFWIYGILLIICLVLFLLDLLIGSVKINPARFIALIFHARDFNDSQLSIILQEFRLPRSLTAILAGMALSVSGLQMQTIFRNPLAGPYVLGISSGASLGVAILVLGVWPAFMGVLPHVPGNWAVLVAAALGSAAVLFLILLVSARVNDIMTILILGLLFGGAVSAIVNILQYFSDEYSLRTFVLWNMGSLSGVTHAQLNILAPAIIAGLVIAMLTSKVLNALLLGETYARTLGVNISLSRFLIFLSTSILAGGITAFCGPIGFIGIAVPHLARMLFKTSNHHFLMPASMLLGAIVMLVSDMICQLPGTDIVLPVNSVTALLGIPVVIWVLLKNVRISSIN
jgi:iron complex transport system permease protein